MFHLADNVYVVGHKSPDTDSVAAAISYANLKNQLGTPEIYVPAAAGTINTETKFVLDHFSVPVPETITDGKGKKIVLVDHNEVGQAVENIKEATIMEVIDHHKIGDITTPNPIFFHNEPVGSTATIVSAMYDQYKVPISREMAGVMMSAILSDTVLFKSPTCTAKDKEEVAKLAKITGEDYQQYGIAMLTAKSDISSKTAMDIVKGDYKHFDFAGTKAGVGQIEVMDLSVLASRKKEIAWSPLFEPGKRIDLVDQGKIALGDGSHAVRHQADRQLLVLVNEQVGMMIRRLGQMGHGIGEHHRLHEIVERQLGMELAVTAQRPIRVIAQARVELFLGVNLGHPILLCLAAGIFLRRL